ncbi:hypothetical protein KAX35_09480 [candidate division WOR-3 bacterium]|nr:hypothetical protein [candidate division WOR-3 bacterium]
MPKKQDIRKKYSEFIRTLRLKNIRLISSSTQIEEEFSLPASVKIKEESDYKVSEKGNFTILLKYLLSAKSKNTKKVGLRIKVYYSLDYSSDITITDEIFNKFKDRNLTLHTWPYFRQYVHETTIRMGLPPLILNVVPIS